MTVLNFPLAHKTTLIILNGDLSLLDNFPTDSYQKILVADGAWNAVKKRAWSKNVTHIMGDGDSIGEKPAQFIPLLDQNFTDFEKILRYLQVQNSHSADVIGASGGEMDHFLGNLSVAAKYSESIQLNFFDTHQCYFYQRSDTQCADSQIVKKQSINVKLLGVLDKIISLYPFPQAIVSSRGLGYEMQNLALDLSQQQSLRNVATDNNVTLEISGAVWVFLSLSP